MSADDDVFLERLALAVVRLAIDDYLATPTACHGSSPEQRRRQQDRARETATGFLTSSSPAYTVLRVAWCGAAGLAVAVGGRARGDGGTAAGGDGRHGAPGGAGETRTRSGIGSGAPGGAQTSTPLPEAGGEDGDGEV